MNLQSVLKNCFIKAFPRDSREKVSASKFVYDMEGLDNMSHSRNSSDVIMA